MGGWRFAEFIALRGTKPALSTFVADGGFVSFLGPEEPNALLSYTSSDGVEFVAVTAFEGPLRVADEGLHLLDAESRDIIPWKSSVGLARLRADWREKGTFYVTEELRCSSISGGAERVWYSGDELSNTILPLVKDVWRSYVGNKFCCFYQDGELVAISSSGELMWRLSLGSPDHRRVVRYSRLHCVVFDLDECAYSVVELSSGKFVARDRLCDNQEMFDGFSFEDGFVWRNSRDRTAVLHRDEKSRVVARNVDNVFVVDGRIVIARDIKRVAGPWQGIEQAGSELFELVGDLSSGFEERSIVKTEVAFESYRPIELSYLQWRRLVLKGAVLEHVDSGHRPVMTGAHVVLMSWDESLSEYVHRVAFDPTDDWRVVCGDVERAAQAYTMTYLGDSESDMLVGVPYIVRRILLLHGLSAPAKTRNKKFKGEIRIRIADRAMLDRRRRDLLGMIAACNAEYKAAPLATYTVPVSQVDTVGLGKSPREAGRTSQV